MIMSNTEIKQKEKEQSSLKKKYRKMSPISLMYYVKLGVRSLFLIAVAVVYGIGLARGGELIPSFTTVNVLLGVIWGIYAVEMVARFFPSRLESSGCQKVFKRSFLSTGEEQPRLMPWKRTLTVVAVWVALNGVMGGLYLFGVIDKGALVLVSLAYGICDMICILFFCPFQTWFMKNRCCADCRIYNWDFAMMFTPLVFIPNVFTLIMLALSLALLLRWEITYKLHPERFATNTNGCISCSECKEKLCHHKKQLHTYWRRQSKKNK